jgi:ribosomal protein L37AE/L43A
VACLCQSALGDEANEICKRILTRNSYCQLVAILPRSSFLTIHEDGYDAILHRPIYEDEFEETVANRLVCGIYSARLHEFYALNAKLLSIRQAETASDSPPDVNIAQLKERYSHLCSQLDTLQEKLSTEYIDDISTSIGLHENYLTRPAQQVDQGSASKYHPSRCPNCKLPWGVDHGNELKEGVVSIGAGVWRCTRCTEIVHGLSESGQRILQA